MANFYPPILANNSDAIPSTAWRQDKNPPAVSGVNYTGWVTIPFIMPTMNDATKLIAEGHVEVNIRFKSNNNLAINSLYSPDYSTFYFDADNTDKDWAYIKEVDKESRSWELVFYGEELFGQDVPIGYEDILGPIADTEYLLQIRFGDNHFLELGNDRPNHPENGIFHRESKTDRDTFENFGIWRSKQVNQQALGEWSNLTTIYSFGTFRVEIPAATDVYFDFIPKGYFTYIPKVNDPLTRLTVSYIAYINGTSKIWTEELTTSITSGENALQQSVEWKSKISPFALSSVSFSAVTSKGVRFSAQLILTPLEQNPAEYSYDAYINTYWGDIEAYLRYISVKDTQLWGEEREDGLISKTFVVEKGQREVRAKFYRININTGEIIQLTQLETLTSFNDKGFILKDYTVEFGEWFEYVGVSFEVAEENISGRPTPQGIIAKQLLSITPDFEEWENLIEEEQPDILGRLAEMPHSYLTTREHQLRLEGNMTLNSISMNTQDAIQTTIGSKYPFYTRNSAVKYKTMQIGALISIHFDPTATFLTLKSAGEDRDPITGELLSKKDAGYWWKESYQEKTLNEDGTWNNTPIWEIEVQDVDSKDISLTELYDKNRRRRGATEDKPRIDEVLFEDEAESLGFYDKQGPVTFNSKTMFQKYTREYTTERTPDMFLLERKFRERVMDWLTDGKPKLFRSTTEGNIIVILSAVTFTPFQNSERMVYSFTATATEVAEYNTENLLKYNLVPSVFEANVDENNPYYENISEIPDEDEVEWKEDQTKGESSYGKRFFAR